VFVDDGRESVSMNWSIVYDVYHPEVDKGFFNLPIDTSTATIILGLVIAMVLAMLIVQRLRQKPPNSPPSNFPAQKSYAEVQPAPELDFSR